LQSVFGEEAAGEGTFHWQLDKFAVVVGVASYEQTTLSPAMDADPV